MGVAGKHFPSHGHDAAGDEASTQQTAATQPSDERIRKESFFGHLLNRPEFAAIRDRLPV